MRKSSSHISIARWLRHAACAAVAIGAVVCVSPAQAKKKFKLNLEPEEKAVLDSMAQNRQRIVEHTLRKNRINDFKSMKESGMLEFMQQKAAAGGTAMLAETPSGALQPALVRKPTGNAAQANQRRPQTQEEIDAKIEQYLAEARAKAPAYVSTKYVAEGYKHPEEEMSKEQLLTYFNVREEGGKKIYSPKAASNKIETNDLYLYFEEKNGSVGPLMMQVYYYADDPLDIQFMDFGINGEHLKFKPSLVDHSRKGRFYSERFVQALQGADTQLADAMGHAHYVRSKYIGKSCNHIKDLSKQQVANLRRAYFLHKLLSKKH